MDLMGVLANTLLLSTLVPYWQAWRVDSGWSQGEITILRPDCRLGNGRRPTPAACILATANTDTVVEGRRGQRDELQDQAGRVGKPGKDI